MPNDYSVQIHNYLTEKIMEAATAVAEEDVRVVFYRGQLEELQWLREYLRANVDLEDFSYY